MHTTYQPGGGSEKALIQRQLHKPDSATDAPSAVKLLRDWLRWYNRCVDCGMCTPDASILSKGLAAITSQVLAQHEETKFRTFMIRSMLNMDGQPTVEAVLEYHRHLLGEMEALASSALLRVGYLCNTRRVNSKDHTTHRVVRLRRSRSSCSLRVTLQPGAIPGRQDSLQVLATVFQAALQVVQAARHASHA